MSNSSPRGAGRLFSPVVCLLLVTLTGYGLFTLSPQSQRTLGIFEDGMWFLDSYAILASSDAVQAGLDPAKPNPLDPLHRPHSYSGWWFGLGKLGLTRADNFLLGGSCVMAFLAMALALLRPATRREVFICAVFILAPPVLLAVIRGNNDLAIFALLGAGLLAFRGAGWLGATVFVVATLLATGLKFYPVVALGALAVVRPAWRTAVFAAAAGFAGALVLWQQWDYFVHAAIPPAGGFYTFGAALLWRDLGWTGAGTIAASLLVLLSVAVWLVRKDHTVGLGDRRWPVRERAAFATGALLLVACWLAGISFAYRWIFAVLLLPWLLRRWRDGNAAAGWTLGLAGLALWMDGLACLSLNLLAVPIGPDGQRVWRLISQPVVWALMGLLAGWLFDLALHFWRELRAQWVWPRWLRPRGLLAGLVIFGLLGYVLAPRAREILGIVDYGAWFLDSYAVLAASDGHQAGLDVAQANPLDPLNRPHRYSDWWFGLAALGFTRTDNFLVGGGWVLASLITGFLTLKPRTHGEAAWLALVALSPSLLQGVVRANNDLVIFSVLGIGLLALRHPGTRGWVGALAAAVVATGLKFYPVVAGAVFLLVRPVRSLVIVLPAALLALGATLLSVWPQLARGIFPIDAGVHVWGGRLWLQDVGLPAEYTSAVVVFIITLAALGLRRVGGPPPPAADQDARPFLLAAVVLLACFASGLNYAYRWIFALWLGPWLWEAWRAHRPGSGLVLGMVPAVLWHDGLLCAAVNLGLWSAPIPQTEFQRAWRLITQPATWLLMAWLAAWSLELAWSTFREWQRRPTVV